MKFTQPTELCFQDKELKLIGQLLADTYNDGKMTPQQAALGIRVEKALQGEVAELYGELDDYRRILNS